MNKISLCVNLLLATTFLGCQTPHTYQGFNKTYLAKSNRSKIIPIKSQFKPLNGYKNHLKNRLKRLKKYKNPTVTFSLLFPKQKKKNNLSFLYAPLLIKKTSLKKRKENQLWISYRETTKSKKSENCTHCRVFLDK